MTDDHDGTSPLGDHSPDRLAIQRQVDLMHMRDRFWKAARQRNPELARALQVDDDMAIVAIWMEHARASPFYRGRALRILVRRFGKLGARNLIRAAAPVSDHPYRLVLRKRAPEELPDPSLPKRLREGVSDADLLKAVLRHEREGLTPDEAIDRVLREAGEVFRGLAGTRKRLNRARVEARKRDYVDPVDPMKSYIGGGPVEEPEFKIADLRGRGRPRKKCDG